jgi:K+-transporting ATPase ATPase B chain
MVDESAITGESAPVLHEAGTDCAAVIAGTCVLTGRIVIEV